MKRNFALLALCVGLCVAAHAFAVTPASSQGPVFQGAPQAPSYIVNSSNTITTCVGDGGFTACTSAPQQLPVAAPQSGTCVVTPAAPCYLLGQAAAVADGGATVPGLTSSSVIVVSPQVTDHIYAESCAASVQAPGGDGGQVTITCGPDAGVANWIRLN